MIPRKTVDEIINKHSVLEKQLSSGVIDKKSFAEKSKEYSILNEIVEDAKNYLLYEKNKLELEKIITHLSKDQILIKLIKICPIPDLEIEEFLRSIRAALIFNISKIIITECTIKFTTYSCFKYRNIMW